MPTILRTYSTVNACWCHAHPPASCTMRVHNQCACTRTSVSARTHFYKCGHDAVLTGSMRTLFTFICEDFPCVTLRSACTFKIIWHSGSGSPHRQNKQVVFYSRVCKLSLSPKHEMSTFWGCMN